MLNKIRKNDIAIIGIALRLPRANSLDEFAQVLAGKQCCIDEAPQQRKKLIMDYKQKIGNHEQLHFPKAAYLQNIDEFDNRFFEISPVEAILMDPNQRVFLETAIDAIEDAGLGTQIRGTNTGVFFAYSNQLSYLEMVKSISPEMESLAVLGNVPPFAPGRLAYHFNLKGPNLVINTLCSSSLTAVHYACKSLIQQECEIAIVGSTRIQVYPHIAKSRIGIESNSGFTKAFTDHSDGTGGGEGSIVIVLKSLAKALKNHDNIYAVIKGSAVNHDGRSSSLTTPNPEMQKEVILQAWQNAGVNPLNIGYIEAHGTGTKLGDPIEIQGLTKAFEQYTQQKQFCAIGSVKTNYGHLDSVAGLLGLIKAVLSVNRKRLYPQLFFDQPNRYIHFAASPVYVNTTLQEWDAGDELRVCGVSSFSLSGSNCHLVVQEAPTDPKGNQVDRVGRYLLTLSASTEERLRVHIKNYKNFVEKNRQLDLDQFCYSANIKNAGYKCRLAILFRNYDELLNFLTDLDQSWETIGRNRDQNILMSDDFLGADDPEVEDYLKTHCQVDMDGMYQAAYQYVKGEKCNWKTNYTIAEKCSMSVPLYPFLKTRYWLTMLTG